MIGDRGPALDAAHLNDAGQIVLSAEGVDAPPSGSVTDALTVVFNRRMPAIIAALS